MAKTDNNARIVVIGAGIGGLTAAAALARSGLAVTVLEAHVYPGGCAGTFYHQGYRFDAGATLAGGYYPNGPMDIVGKAAGIDRWPIRRIDPAMLVHLPDGAAIQRWSGDMRFKARREAFGHEADDFWAWQEATADALWNLALRMPPWPPQTLAQIIQLIQSGSGWLADDLRSHIRPGLWRDAFRPVSTHLVNASERLRLFVDAQLLISAQTTSRTANAMYGAAALDLPRRGVVHLEGGMGSIAETLAQAVRNHGGKVLYRQEVTRIIREHGKPVAVETKRGDSFPVDILIANLPPWNIAKMLDDPAPRRLRNLPERPQRGWGAFMVYLGLDERLMPRDFPAHHQIVVGRPLAEGNSVFMSLSPAGDQDRAPLGRRAVTLSTHTGLSTWWDLFERDRSAYQERKAVYTARLLRAAAHVLPELLEATDLILPATPITFRRFTRREWGWVGGFPQTNLFQAWGPKIGRDLWMAGDSIFPGQSGPAVALGGLRVADHVLREMGTRLDRIGLHESIETALLNRSSRPAAAPGVSRSKYLGD